MLQIYCSYIADTYVASVLKTVSNLSTIYLLSQLCPHTYLCVLLQVYWICTFFAICTQMEPLIKESTSRLAEKISAVAESGETVEALQ